VLSQRVNVRAGRRVWRWMWRRVSAGSEVRSLSGGCLDARRVPVIFLVSAWAKDKFRCGLIPQGGGEIGASVRVRGLVDVFGRRKTKYRPCAFVGISRIGAWRVMQGAINGQTHCLSDC
jgi:hypothetical protein